MSSDVNGQAVNTNENLARAEEFLKAGDAQRAWSIFDQLRPNVRFGLEGLILSTRFHLAAKRWPQVDVLCRVLRKEHPNDHSGFTLAAQALHEQGRGADAIQLLQQFPWASANPEVQATITRRLNELSIQEKTSV